MNVPDTKLRSAKPNAKPYKIQIGGNTYLEVLPTGRKVWRMRYLKPATKAAADYTIGKYPDITQPQARNLAQEAKQLVKRGIDPTAHRNETAANAERERKAALRAMTESFESVARAWHKHRNETLKKWKPGHAAKILDSLEADVFPHIGELHIADVTAPLLLDVVQAVVDRGAVETARKLNQRLGAIFRYAATRRMVRHNEADNLRDELPVPKRKNNPHLQEKEIPAFLQAIEADATAGAVVKIGILFTMHTLARTNETRFAKWSEFNFDAGEWLIPAERMKMKLAHVVPLTPQVLEMLDELRKFTGNCEYLFATRSNDTPMSENAMLYAIYRLGYRGKLTIHGLRGTASTLLNEVGYRSEVIETALAHKEKNAIRGAYNHAIYLEERRDMLTWYSNHLDTLRTSTGKVIAGRFGKARA
jgi:integrase